jgi:hypothetical protein
MIEKEKNMDILFETITDLLNSLIPTGSILELELATLNEFLAYVISIGIFWVFLLKPLLKILRLTK